MANTPSADEQFMLELINRFRANPSGEAALLTGANAQANVQSAINYFGVSVSAFQQQLAGLAAVAPVAWNDSLAAAAAGHNQAMIAVDQQTHQAPGEPELSQRAVNAGYSYRSLGENIFAFASDVVNAHAGFVIDWGYDAEDYSGNTLLPNFATLGDGIQDPAGHRLNLLNAAYTEVGLAVTAENNSATQVGPLVVTQDFGTRFNYQPQFLGVVFNDTDRNNFYGVGEGLGGVTVTLQSAAGTYTTTTAAAGGWQVAVPGGTYQITFSGGGLSAPVVKSATIGSVNVKVDAIAGGAGTVIPPGSRKVFNDFNGDGRSDILWRNDDGSLSDWLGTAIGGFTDNGGAAGARVSTDWKIAGTNDFNGDGRSDIVWRNDNGSLSTWLAQANGGFTDNGAASFTRVSTDWKIAGTGDFNGDGRADLVWRNDDGSLSTWLGTAAGGFVDNGAASFTRVSTDWKIAGTGDFNGDGRSDLVWRRNNGQVSVWLGKADGGFVDNGAVAGAQVSTDWTIAGTADFNGDGRSDVIWRNVSGYFSTWLGNSAGGLTDNGAASAAFVLRDWKLAATGDYNGDGRSDVVWRNSITGALSTWLGTAAGGLVDNGNAFGAVVPNDWQIAGGKDIKPKKPNADFNGDGRSDILWRNVNGQLSQWLGTANGGFIDNGGVVSASVPSSWRVVGTGDFNGDGRADILWRNDNGQLSNWLGNVNGGYTDNGGVAGASVPTSWKVVGTGDFNGDGRSDILWRNDNGQLSEWVGTANGGFTDNGGVVSNVVSNAWTVAGVGDFNGDGRDDILWRNSNGALVNWLGNPNGGFTDNTGVNNPVAPLGWNVVGVGDFNGDGRSDILWRNDNGALSDWLGTANGSFYDNGGIAGAVVPTSWKVAGIGDFNGDGRDDILWRNDNGDLSDWLGKSNGGFTDNGAASFASVPTTWHTRNNNNLITI